MNDLISIENKILVIRGQQVMLDKDLAEIYGYEVKALNQQVKRNISRFPDDFMFELTREEIDFVKSQFVTSPNNNWYSGQEGGRRKPPLAFTEQGVYMLATVLHGELAEQQTITIMRTFKKMRHYFAENAGIISRLSDTETKFNVQYPIGASLKDLGKKCFGFTRLEEAQLMIKTVLGAV